MLLHLTDIHLNFIGPSHKKRFFDEIRAMRPDAVFLTGDIGEAPDLASNLTDFGNLNIPTYFVLGNHDYYRSCVDDVREIAVYIASKYSSLHYCTLEGLAEFAYDKQLVSVYGVDGWADGRLGDYENSLVRLNDSVFIEDLAKAANARIKYDSTALLAKMRELADADASKLRSNLRAANPNVIILTHLPPFAECSRYNGKISDPDYLCYYSCKAVGDVIYEFAKIHPNVNILVLCGHTHEAFKWVHPDLTNLHVRVGGAKYSEPKIDIINLPCSGKY